MATSCADGSCALPNTIQESPREHMPTSEPPCPHRSPKKCGSCHIREFCNESVAAAAPEAGASLTPGGEAYNDRARPGLGLAFAETVGKEKLEDSLLVKACCKDKPSLPDDSSIYMSEHKESATRTEVSLPLEMRTAPFKDTPEDSPVANAITETQWRETILHGPLGNVLREALLVINGDRRASYGDPRENFSNVAAMWSAYKGVRFSSRDVALMMILLKVARDSHAAKTDNIVDIAGYAGLVESL